MKNKLLIIMLLIMPVVGCGQDRTLMQIQQQGIEFSNRERDTTHGKLRYFYIEWNIGYSDSGYEKYVDTAYPNINKWKREMQKEYAKRGKKIYMSQIKVYVIEGDSTLGWIKMK